jgi:uncharacterized protein
MADRNEQDVEFLEYVIKSIVDHPDDVKVDRTVDEMGVLLSLNVNPEDMGQVIGRSGGTAKSVRTLLRVIGARNNARVNLKIIEPEGSERGKERQMKATEPEAEPKKSADTDAKEDAIDEALDDLKV